MKKPKSKLETKLSEEQQAKLADWLLDGMQYHQAQEVVAKEFGVRVSLRAFTPFWDLYCAPSLVQRRNRAVSTSEEIAAEAAKRPGQFDKATIDALKQKSFELAIKPNADPKEVKALFSLVLKAGDQSLEWAKFRRETCELFVKWFDDQRAKNIMASSESNATKIEQLGKAMFQELWDAKA
jgi:predicted O-linked N-acetylglucosamine transferase (SPINDLY family)